MRALSALLALALLAVGCSGAAGPFTGIEGTVCGTGGEQIDTLDVVFTDPMGDRSPVTYSAGARNLPVTFSATVPASLDGVTVHVEVTARLGSKVIVPTISGDATVRAGEVVKVALGSGTGCPAVADGGSDLPANPVDGGADAMGQADRVGGDLSGDRPAPPVDSPVPADLPGTDGPASDLPIAMDGPGTDVISMGDVFVPECASDGDCSQPTPHCNMVEGKCRECVDVAHCPTDRPLCQAGTGTCVCESDANCVAQPRLVCSSATQSCVVCGGDADCQAPGKPFCDRSIACVGCLTDGNCVGNPNGTHCEPNSRTCVQCLGSSDCPMDKPVCDMATHKCKCGGDTDCSSPTGRCNLATATCVRCLGNGDCSAPTNICDTSTGTCTSSCTSSTQCSAPTPACNTTSQKCVECTADGNCSGNTPVCDTAINQCVCRVDNDCPGGSFCNAARTCQPKFGNGTVCSTGNQCTGGHCLQAQNDTRCSAIAACGLCQVINNAGTLCVSALGGSDPKSECATDVAACRSDSCDGSGACAPLPNTQQCAGPSCSGTTLTSPGFCSGTSTTCLSGTQSSCSPYRCGNGTACATSCAASTDCFDNTFSCGGGGFCKLANGQPCGAASECTSNHCVDGFCCSSTCTTTCKACNVPGSEGFCLNVPTGFEPPHGTCSACGCTGGGQCCTAQACIQGLCDPP